MQGSFGKSPVFLERSRLAPGRQFDNISNGAESLTKQICGFFCWSKGLSINEGTFCRFRGGGVAIFPSRGPSVGHRTIYRSEGAFRLSEGPSVGQRVALRLVEASVGQKPPSVKKYFIDQRVPPSLNARGPSVGHRTI